MTLAALWIASAMAAYPEQNAAIYPLPNDPAVPIDAVLFIKGSQTPMLMDDAGLEVATTSYLLDGYATYAVVPEADLTPGLYQISASAVPRDFTVVDEPAPIQSPVAPCEVIIDPCFGRFYASYLDYNDPSVDYAMGVYQWSATEPAAPTVADLQGSLPAEWIGPQAVIAPAPGAAARLWLGGFDKAGRFSGWWSDEPILIADHKLSYASPDFDPSSDAGCAMPPTELVSCVPCSASVEDQCPTITDPDTASTEDTGTTSAEDAGGKTSCGCTAAPVASAWLAPWLALYLRRRG
jgi:hypothetical protein